MPRLPLGHGHVLATHLHGESALETVALERELGPGDGLVVAFTPDRTSTYRPLPQIGGRAADERVIVAEHYKAVRPPLAEADVDRFRDTHVFDMRKLKAHLNFIAPGLQGDVLRMSGSQQEKSVQQPHQASHELPRELVLHE
jgi:hypothetical protein